MSVFLAPNTAAIITVAASDKLATWSRAAYTVTQTLGYPNVPDTDDVIYNNSGLNTTSAFSAATTVTIQAGDGPLFYMTGTGPVISEIGNLESVQAAPGALNATGTLTAALILGGIVTSTTAAGVTATLDTGAVMEAVVEDMAVNDAFEWSVINTGPNTFTVTAASGHTVVGAGAVATATSGRFLTRKTANETFVTYRLA